MNKKSQMMMPDARLMMNGHQQVSIDDSVCPNTRLNVNRIKLKTLYLYSFSMFQNVMTPPSHMSQASHIDHQSQQQQSQVNSLPQQQNQPLNPNYPHQSQSVSCCRCVIYIEISIISR